MSWKSVEMQVALPRIQDAGKIQEQMQQRGQHVQDSITSSQLLSEQEKRKKVNDYNQKDNVKNKKKEGQESVLNQDKQKDDLAQEKENRSDHPYLGSQIDFNG
ncbi:hypothetical protein [Aquibacillus saliphilus]|uniref:hypothetical protein n=1 Tax=Aquibacillus saliphilus TaxID=1909422 RepID=UPI001CEFFE7D|nr:hypothetical protein [Aquibacillus saliphilus]